MARILITGASGFLGRHVISRLSREHEIYALARHIPDLVLHNDVHWVEHDLAKPLDNLKTLPARVDTVIHLAQSRHYRSFPSEATDIFCINATSTFNLLEYARSAQASHFLLGSTGGLYGTDGNAFPEDTPVDLYNLIDKTPTGPLNFYFTSKYIAELLLANYRQFFCPVILRFFFLFGPGQQGMLIPNLVKKVLEDQPITIQGKPGMLINPLHIEDAWRVFEPAMKLDNGGVFNVAGDEVVSITELVQRIASLAGREPHIQYLDGKNPGNLLGDNKKMKEKLGIFPTTTLRDGLKSMIFSQER